MESEASFPRTIIILLTLLLLLLSMLCNRTEGYCRNLEIRTIMKDTALTNHTIRTIQPITDARTCRAQCFLESLCFGVNFCVDQNGTPTCELTNSDHIRSKRDLVDEPGCTFYGSESACSSNPCVSNATCQGDFVQDPRPYRCVCPTGYTGQMCEIDIDECTLGNHGCHGNATCNNTNGGHNCTCKTGFYGNGTSCYDINECTSGVHGCGEHANCTNFPGGHKCTCNNGFHGDGKVCVDLDECTVNTHDCHVNATCNNTIGGHNCTCKKNFYGNGTSCYDIDECSSGAHDCHVNATCSNTIGGYNCKCKAPSYGDGTVCFAPENCTELRSLLIRFGQEVPEGGIIGQGTNRRYCVFSEIPGCDLGPWTLAMKVDGSLHTFEYDSPLWTNTLTYNPGASDHGLDETETKSSAFWNTPLNKICFGMKYGGVKRWLSFDIQENSLYDVMNKTSETSIHVGEPKWRTLLPRDVTSLQKTCSKEGFNLDGGTKDQKRLLRFGLFKDNQSNCLSYSAFLGLAGVLEGFEKSEIPICGNFAALAGSDNGEMATPAFCYVLVQ